MTKQSRLASHRWATVVPALLLIASCTAPPTTHSATIEAMPPAEGGMTSQELVFARDLARAEIAKDRAAVTSATVTADNIGLDVSNTGYGCTSSRILHIKLIGTFPGIAVSPHAGRRPDPTPRAVTIDADGKTGRACLVGVQTGEQQPASSAVTLHLG